MGVAFSLLADLPAALRRPLLVSVGIGVLAVLFVCRRRLGRGGGWAAAALAFIVAAALGNLIDRPLCGYVIDLICLHRWPIFNAADVWIAAGVLLLLMTQWRQGRTAGP